MGEIGEISGGGTPSTTTPHYWNGLIPWLVPSDVTRHGDLFVSDTQRTITEAGLANSSAHLMPSGSVLMTSRATIGEVVINAQPMATNQGFINIKADPEQVSNEFLAYWIMRNKSVFVDRAHGVTFKEITKANFRTIPISLPTLSEQHAIARVLRAIQAAKEARERELALEREHKAALMEQLFTHGTRGEPIKHTEIGTMPESWGVSQLGNVGNVRYGLGQPPGLDKSGIPMVRATDIKAGRIVSDTVIRIKESEIPESRNPYLQAGDVLVVRSGAYTGDVALYDGRWPKAVAGYDLVVSPMSPKLNSEFLASYLLGATAQRHFRSRRDRSAQPHLNADQLRNTLVPLPQLFEQSAIASALHACDAKIAALGIESVAMDELFRALLEELMTGHISAIAISIPSM